MKKRLIINLFFDFLLTACGSEATSSSTAPASAPENTPVDVAEQFRVSNPLLGSWTSTEDTKSGLAFGANETLAFTYNGEVEERVKYNLVKNCEANQLIAGTPRKGDYLRLTDGSNCYAIVDITEDELVLSLVGRGNTLRYRR